MILGVEAYLLPLVLRWAHEFPCQFYLSLRRSSSWADLHYLAHLYEAEGTLEALDLAHLCGFQQLKCLSGAVEGGTGAPQLPA